MEWLLIILIHVKGWSDPQVLTVGGYKHASGCLDAAVKVERQLMTDTLVYKVTTACVPGRRV